MAREWSDLFIVDGRASEGPPGDRGEEEGERQRRGGRFRRLRENLRKTRQALTAEVQATLFEELDDETWERLEEPLTYADVEVAIREDADVVLVDTAGRLHTQQDLMGELAKVSRVIAKQIPEAPHETLLTVDATTGQNGLRQARLFSEAVPVSGLVLTKLDGTAKGGIALAIAQELGIPVKLIGIGERLEDLRPFEAAEFARALVAA